MLIYAETLTKEYEPGSGAGFDWLIGGVT